VHAQIILNDLILRVIDQDENCPESRSTSMQLKRKAIHCNQLREKFGQTLANLSLPTILVFSDINKDAG
jgi:hypothetical protein